MRLSRYIVTSPRGDDILLFSTRSAEFLTVDRNLFDQLANSAADIPKDISELLLELKVLVPEDEDELKAILAESRGASANRCTLHMVVVPTSACALGCNLPEYGGYCGQKHSSGRMSNEVQANLVRSVRSGLKEFHSMVSISWFGGEPLAALDVIRSLTPQFKKAASEANCTYHADVTTGGTLLTREVARECFHELAIGAFSVSVDGSKEHHDKRRCTKGGRPTYDRIMRNLSDIIEDGELSDAKISIRCNVDKRNVDSVPALIDIIADQGWQRRVDFYFVPVHHWSGADSSSFRYEPAEFASVEMGLIAYMIERGFTPYLLPEKKPVVCRVVSESNIVVGHDGAIHKCTESPLTPLNRSKDIIGQAGDPTLFVQSKNWRWHDELQAKEQPCSSCSFLPVCGGGCPLAWHRGDQPCPTFKFNMSQRLEMLDRLSADKTHPYQRANAKPARGASNPKFSEFEPIAIAQSSVAALGLRSDDLMRLQNHLRSARIKAREGLLRVAQYQFELAEVLRTDLSSASPRASTLLRASARATEAYIALKKKSPELAVALLKEACIDLKSAATANDTLDVIPAQLQALANMVKVQFRFPHANYDPHRAQILHFLERGGSLSVGPITVSFELAQITRRHPALIPGFNASLQPQLVEQ